MSEKIDNTLVVFFSFLSISPAFGHTNHNFGYLREKYPYGILGNTDYGILNKSDLAINDCQAEPKEFSDKSTSYMYWQCFSVETAKLFCDGSGYDETEKTRLTVMVISGLREGIRHEYITSRAIPLADCRSFSKDWHRLLKGESHVCVAGAFSYRDRNESGQEVYHWDLDRFKTKKGCDSYFVGGCNLAYQLKHGCTSITRN